MSKEKEIKYVKSLAEFMEVLLSAIEPFEEAHKIWYRGLGSEEFDLIPNLFRGKTQQYKKGSVLNDPQKFSRIEENIDSSFSRKTSQFFRKNGIEDNLLNKYFLKQHYGIKTRLLDWTESALIALYFAIREENGKNAKFCILYPFILNNYSITNNKSIQDVEHLKSKNFYTILGPNKIDKKGELINDSNIIKLDELMRRYYRLDCTESTKMYPIAIYPPYLDDRMASQQACFTLFGNIPLGLDNFESQEKFIDFIYIDKNSKRKILRQLNSIGVNHYSAFPDLDGLGKSINYDFSDTINQINSDEYFRSLIKNQIEITDSDTDSKNKSPL
ncbi:FRG domain-containing protein [Daejeonella rubra]|uniref:FRG domain-containing protein n=1 Tax=Daejeonella rubra TaxID=990371 RepID=A0A1G9XRX4_9SPHI|nr:FRG domain-containing protein [Daejeonella rubra]SDM99518.1 FRG domain-containing protein [Daejeonella rubra]